MKRPNANLVAGVLIALGLVIWPYLGHSQQYQLTRLEYIFTGLMVAIGLNVVTGFAGQLSLGPGAVYAIGGYTAAVFADHFPSHFGLIAMCAVAVAGAAVVGLLIGVPSLRVGGFYLGMTTLFVALLIPTVVSNLKITGKEQGISLLSNIDWQQRWTGTGLYQITLAAVLLLVLGSWWLLASRVGHRFVTLATSEELAISLGIAPFRTKLFAFLLSALPAGLGGAFYVYTQQFIAPGSVSAQFSIYLLAACVVGGFGTVLGPFVGGLLVIGLSQYLGGFEQWEGLIFGVLLIGFAVGLPEGITGFRRGRVGGVIAAPLARTLRLPGSRASIAAAAVAPGAIAASPDHVTALLDKTEPKQLVIVGATRSFGGVAALDDVDLTVEPGTIHGLIGSNGSGKTTLLNAVSGFYRIERGMITLGDVRIERAAPHRVARAGVARTFQTPKLIERGTLIANITVAVEQSGVRGRRRVHDAAVEWLRAVGLEDRVEQVAAAQPHGIRRLVEVARALALRPSVVLLDEPGAGLSAAEIDVLRDVIVAVAKSGPGVLLIEHNVPLVLDIADEVTALHEGRRIAVGRPEDVAAHPDVIQAFLGTTQETTR